MDRLFIAPGNHDIERDADGRSDAILESIRDYSPKNGTLPPDKMLDVHSGHAEFREMMHAIYHNNLEMTACYDNDEKPHFVKETKADAVIRGIRNSIDFEYELPLAQANYKLDYKADTIFLATLPEHSYISSSAVRELVRYKGDIKGFVPDVVYQFIVQKFDYMI